MQKSQSYNTRLDLLSITRYLITPNLTFYLKLTQSTALVEKEHHVTPPLSSAFRNL